MKHTNHDRLINIYMGCENVYNTKDHILHHMLKHYVSIAFNLCLGWIMPSGRATILEHMTAAHVQCKCLALDVDACGCGHKQYHIPCHKRMGQDDSQTPAQGLEMSTTPKLTTYTIRPSKCLNHYNQRLCKMFLAGVNLLLQTNGVLL